MLSQNTPRRPHAYAAIIYSINLFSVGSSAFIRYIAMETSHNGVRLPNRILQIMNSHTKNLDSNGFTPLSNFRTSVSELVNLNTLSNESSSYNACSPRRDFLLGKHSIRMCTSRVRSQSRTIGSQSRTIRSQSHIIGTQSRTIGSQSRTIGTQSRTIGFQSCTIGSQRRTIDTRIARCDTFSMK